MGDNLGVVLAELFKGSCRISGMVLVLVLVDFGIPTILDSIVNDASRNHIVLVLFLHVGIGTHAEQFFSEHDNRLGVANQTANALGHLRVILTRTGSTVSPEVVGNIVGVKQISLDRHAEVFINNEGQFPLKKLNVLHGYQFLSHLMYSL